MKNYISVGITGGIGSGKSFVCRIIEAMGYPVFYSDAQAKRIISSDTEAVSAIKALFGEEAYIGNELNRPFLAEKIFSDPSLRSKMNEIVHPLVRKAFDNWATQSESEIVFNEAAILFETGGYKAFDKTILITAPQELKIKRVQQRDLITTEQIKERMHAQWADEAKIPLADFVINNDEQQPLVPQIVEMIESLK